MSPPSDSPLFSVVVPTYGRRAFLADALASIQRQSVSDFECLVVDDGSLEPAEVPKDPRFRLLRHPVNRGQSAARNTGLRTARGRYVTFLDDDDQFTDDRLEIALQGLERAPIAVCWARFLDGLPSQGRLLEGDLSDVILEGLTPNLGATAVERALVPEFDETFLAYEDVEWWLRLAQAGVAATIARTGYLVRRHDEPRINSQVSKRLRFNKALLDRHASYFQSHPRAAAFRWKRAGLVALQGHRRDLARRALWCSLRLRPQLATAKHLAGALRP